MSIEITETTAMKISRIEKDPNTCLVYKVFGLNGELLPRGHAVTSVAAQTKDSEGVAPLGGNSAPKICADGDSWINILIEVSQALGYHKTFFDVLESHYYSASTAWPGDTFEKMLLEKSFKQHIDSGIFDFFIFSGGGNDVLGGGALTKLLKPKANGDASSDPEKYLRLDRIEAVLRTLMAGYLEIAQYVQIRSPRTLMLVHGYDYPIATAKGPWLGAPFRQRNFDLKQDAALIASILEYLVDRFYGMLDKVARKSNNVKVVNVRNIVKSRWADELHPKKEASEDIAAVYRRIIDGTPIV
nr:hypothetical protein [Pseudomonadota bacterium]